MAYFTGRGDDGTTGTYKKGQSMSKASLLAEALGTIDELNSLLGWVKTQARSVDLSVPHAGGTVQVHDLLDDTQRNLFIVQAELAGDETKQITDSKIKRMEEIIENIEEEVPEVKSFLIPGATEMGALFDVARTVTRRAERRTVEALELNLMNSPDSETNSLISDESLAYLNRLSSFMYAFVRLSNYRLGGGEEAPDYK